MRTHVADTDGREVYAIVTAESCLMDHASIGARGVKQQRREDLTDLGPPVEKGS